MNKLFLNIALALSAVLLLLAPSDALAARGRGLGIGVHVGGYAGRGSAVNIRLGGGYYRPYGTNYPYDPYRNGAWGGYAPYPGYINVWVDDVLINYVVTTGPNGVLVRVPRYTNQRRLVTAHWDSFRGGYWYWNGSGYYVPAVPTN